MGNNKILDSFYRKITIKEGKSIRVVVSLDVMVSKFDTPNVSTLLGAHAINFSAYKKSFEEYVKGLLPYFKLRTYIFSLTDRNLSYGSFFLSLSYFLALVSFEKVIKVKGPGGFIGKKVLFINLKNFLMVTYLKLGLLCESNLMTSYGTLQSLGIHMCL